MRFKSAGATLVLSGLLALGVSGCSKSTNAAGEERTDAQVAGDVQTHISADPALAGRQISINANKGVVTLSGDVQSDSEVTAALNDAQQAQGVKQVVSRLAIQQASAAPQPEPTPAPAPVQQERSERSQRKTTRATSTTPHSRHSLPSGSQSYSDTTTTASNSGVTTSTGGNFGSSAPENTTAVTTPPPPPPPPQKVTVPAGTVLQVRTVEGLSSESNHENDIWHGTLNSDITVDDQTVIPAGADVSGRVMEAHAATHYSGGASLVLAVEHISFNGKSYQIATDTWERKAATRGKNTAEKVGGGAAVGAILGGIFGGGRGAAIGATAGAGAGAGANTITKGQPVNLRPETLVSFRLQNPITVNPSASTGRHGQVIRPDDSDQPQQ